MKLIKNHLYNNLFLGADYENNNPGSDSISVDEAGFFCLIQNFEEGADPGYSFHINVILVNKGASPVLVPIRINWAERNMISVAIICI